MTEITPNDWITSKNLKELVYQQWSKVPGLTNVDFKIRRFYLEGDTEQQYFQLGWVNFNGIVVPLAMIMHRHPDIDIHFYNLYNRHNPAIRNLVHHLGRSYKMSYADFENYLIGGTSQQNYVRGMTSFNKWLDDYASFQDDNVIILPPGFDGMALSQNRLKKIYQKNINTDWSKITHYKRSNKKGI